MFQSHFIYYDFISEYVLVHLIFLFVFKPTEILSANSIIFQTFGIHMQQNTLVIKVTSFYVLHSHGLQESVPFLGHSI